MPHFVSSMLMVSVFWCISASSRNKLNHAINGNGVETPKELKDWFAAFTAEISGNLLYDVLKSECGIIMIRKIKDALQNKVKQSANAQPHTQPDIQEKAQATGGTKNEWTTVVRKNQRKALVDLALRAREWDAPVLQAHEVITNSTGVAILTKEAAESKLSMVKSTGRLAVLTEQQFPVASHVARKRVQFTCLDGDKIVPREGFLYQLGEAPVRRVVEQGCAVLKQSCATASIVCEVEQCEAPQLWKRFRKYLGKTEGDDSADKPKLKDETRAVLHELGLPKPVDVWMRPKSFVHQSAGGSMLQVMLRVEVGSLNVYLKASGQNGVYFQEARTRDSVTDYKVIWLPKDQGFKQALQSLVKLDAAKVFGLARTGQSRGIRVLKADEGAMRRILRPDHEEDGLNVTGSFEVKGWPVDALSKQDVKEALHSKWRVRPLFSRVEGRNRTWTVAADEPVLEIVVDAWGNSCLLEISSKQSRMRGSGKTPVVEAPLRMCQPVPVQQAVVQKVPEVGKEDASKVLETMRSMMAQMQTMVDAFSATVVEQVVPEVPVTPSGMDLSPKDTHKEEGHVDEDGSGTKGRTQSRTPRRRMWQVSPSKGGPKES